MTAPDKIWAYSYDVNTSQGPLDVWKTINTWSDATVQPITAVEYTRTSIVKAAVAAAYEAGAQVCDSGNAGAFWGKAIRALATPDQIAALTAVRAATVTVKPLVWEARSYEWSWWADTALGRGTYQIRCEGGIGYLVDFDGVIIGEPHDTLEAAKAAAQADYDARIRSAITITSGVVLAEIGGA